MKVSAMYFSPTKTTETVVLEIAESLSKELDSPLSEYNITKEDARKNSYSFGEDDVLVLGLPVYSGRIPEIVEDYIKNIKGDNSKAVIVSVYGNANIGDALLEMKNILTDNGFKVIAGASFIGEHSFTDKLAKDRPDINDLKIAKSFAKEIASKINQGNFETVDVVGEFPYKERGAGIPAAPSTNEDCISCLICVYECTTSAISEEDPKEIDADKCILCCNCIKVCPQEAKLIDNEDVLAIVKTLEDNFQERKEPEIVL